MIVLVASALTLALFWPANSTTVSASDAPAPTDLPALPGLELVHQLRNQRRLGEAEDACWRLIAWADSAHGPESLETACAQMAMISILRLAGLSAAPEATALAERPLAVIEGRLGRWHLDTGRALDELASVRQDCGDLTRARVLFERKLAIQDSLLGPRHSEVGKTANKLGMLLHELGDWDEARCLYDRAYSVRMRALGPKHPETIATLDNLAVLAGDRGDDI